MVKSAVWPGKYSLQNVQYGYKLGILCPLGFVCGRLLRSALENWTHSQPQNAHLLTLEVIIFTMDIAYDSQKAGEIHISLFLKIYKFIFYFIADQLEVVALERLNSPHSGIQISLMHCLSNCTI